MSLSALIRIVEAPASGSAWLESLNAHADVYFEASGKLIEIVGVTIVLVGATIATAQFLWHVVKRNPFASVFHAYRSDLGRGILLGLEFLIAGDIIGTVAVEPDLTNLAVLAGIVLIRTFLSYSIEVEITGRWPWQHSSERDRKAV